MDNSFEMNHKKLKPSPPWLLIIFFIVVSSGVIITGFFYFKGQQKHILDLKISELSSISDLKTRQINQLRLARIGEAKFLIENKLLINKFLEFLKKPDNNSLRSDLIVNMRSLANNFGYRTIFLLDSHEKLRLSYPETDTIVGNYLRTRFPEIIKGRKGILTDLHKDDQVNFVNLNLVLPIIDWSARDSAVSGFISLRIDPRDLLYPLVQSWPSTSKTAESYLVRKEGNEIIYLNELRHLKNTQLNFRKPVTEVTLPEVMAFSGMNMTTRAIDYRGVRVIASMKKVPGTAWYIVSKIDIDEIFSYLESQRTMDILIMVLFIMATGSILGILWRNQRVRFYREKFEAEQSRLVLAKHYEYILKYANDIIIFIDKDLTILESNDRALEVYGYSRKEFIGMNVTNLRPADLIPKLFEQITLLKQKRSATFEAIHKRKDGTLFPIEISAKLVEIEGEQYYHTISRDITERKRIENQIEESNSLLLATLESTADGILVVDLNGKIVQFNGKFAEMWKIPEAIMVSRNDENALSFVRDQLKDPDSFLENVRHLYESPDSVSSDLLEFKDGRIFERYSQPQKINDNIIGRVWSFRDITLRKTAEYQLINAKEKAEESDRLKTAFLHNISHEIRTPMNAIVGFTALLDDQDLQSETRKQYMDIIYQSSNQLLSIITDIVDISNIETGQTRITINQVNINTVLRTLYEQYCIRAGQHISIQYKLSLNDDEALLETDGIKLIQILSNLLNNSLKFTMRGKIEFGYFLRDGLVEFFVSDTGIGISKDKQVRIFERFYQVDNSTVRQYSGTGLGLSICRAYAELLGGNIRVESDPGEGSTFYLTLPDKFEVKKTNSIQMETEKISGSYKGKTLLIAEDDDINYLVVQQTLKTENFNLVRAVNGKEAVEICRLNGNIDLVLLDLKMPVMDGLEAMRLIREFRTDLPFVALSAYAFDSDRMNAIEQGCVDYISKPFTKIKLLEIIGKYL
jgi:PAS domain S-box-containing protein